MAKTLDELLREIEAESVKTAADEESSSGSESASQPGSDLSETLSKILEPKGGKAKKEKEKPETEEESSESEEASEKKSCAKTASAIDEIEKLAEEVKASQYNELIKEAQLLGAALIDGAMLRQQEWEKAASEEAVDFQTKLAEELNSDPVAYAAFLKGAEDAAKEESEESEESESESESKETSEKSAADLEAIRYMLETDPEAAAAFEKGASDAMAENELETILASDPEAAAAFEKGASDAMAENELLNKIAEDPEAAAAFQEGAEDAMVEKIASDPEMLEEALKLASEDPLLEAGLYLGSPEVPVESKVEILDAAYKEAQARGDAEAIEDLNKIAEDIANEKVASDVFNASSQLMDGIINELNNS